MMKNIKTLFIMIALVGTALGASAQNTALKIGTNPTTKNASAVLELESTNKGFLAPRIPLLSNTDVVTIPAPATGLLVYNTGVSTLKYVGYVFWNGTEWRSLDNSPTNPSITALNCAGVISLSNSFTSGVAYSGTVQVPYTNGNGGSYTQGTPIVQNGLTFTLNPGTLAVGSGLLVYTVTGTPNFSSPTTISVPITFLGNTCNIVLGENGSSFAVGQIKSARIIVPISPFKTNGGSRNMMTGVNASNISTTNRQAAYEKASASEQAKFIIIKGLRLDFMESTVDGQTCPKFYNTTGANITYNLSALSTNDRNIGGNGTTIVSNYYSYFIDGNDDFATSVGPGGGIEYVNAMLTFPDGEWYNVTFHATIDTSNYYFYMTAQRLN